MVKSAARVADILNLLGQGAGELSASDVARQLNLPRSSAHSLLNTLLRKGVVTRDARGNYALSIALLALASNAFDVFDIRQSARPIMQDISAQFQVASNLAVLDGPHVIYIANVHDTARPTKLTNYVGSSVPAHATALGKVLVAELPHWQREQWLAGHVFEPITSRTATDRAQFEASLEDYIATGYAVEDEESHEGVIGFAAPVLDQTRKVVAAIGLSGVKSRVLVGAGDRTQFLGATLRRAADTLSARLGYRPQELIR